LLTYEAMNNSDDIVLVLERGTGAQANDAVIIGANDAFRRASGYSNEQILDRAVADLFQSGNHAETLMNAVRGNGSLRSELAASRADGGSFMLGMHLMPAPARTPGRDCFVILGRDITSALEARRMQDSIQRLLAKVFSSVDAAVAIVNSAGRIVMTNPGIDLLLGYKPNGLVGRNSMDLVAPGSRASVAATLKQQANDGGTVTYSASFLRMDGSALLLRITSVTAATGDTKQFLIITVRPEAIDTPRIRSESVGRIKLVGLEEVRAALGDRWPAAAERAMATAEVVIKRHCGPQDSFSRADEISFLMCFGSLSEEESSFRAAMIGREIRNKLIGDGQDPENAQVRALVAVVRFPDQGESGAALNAVLLDGLDRQIERVEREARQTLANAMTSAVCDVEPAYGRAPAEMVASQVFIPPRLERQLQCVLSALPLKESQAFDLDGFLLGLAAQHAVGSMARGDITPVLLRISFDVFATRVTTERFFALCAKIDPRVTARLVLLLSSLPNGLPRSRLQDCVNRLRPFCRGVGYHVDDVADVPEIDLSNSSNPIVVLPVAACGASTPAKLRVLFTSLQTRRAKILIRGVGSEKDAAALRALGVDMVSMKRLEAA
jgi:PAS domain S-box-containing protein